MKIHIFYFVLGMPAEQPPAEPPAVLNVPLPAWAFERRDFFIPLAAFPPGRVELNIRMAPHAAGESTLR